MATQRQFGQGLDQNVRRGPNMRVEIRDCIVVMIIDSCRVTEAAEAYDQPVCTAATPTRNIFKLALHKTGLAAGDF
jgi:hypothetical protein